MPLHLIYSQLTPSPRLQYAADLVLGRLLGLPLQLVPEHTYRPDQHQPAIGYGAVAGEQLLRVPASGLLDESGIRDWQPRVSEGSIPRLFPIPRFDWPYDILSAAFFLASEYRHYLPGPKDAHGRYLDDEVLAQLRLDELPLVHSWAREFEAWLLQQLPVLKGWQQKVSYQPELTFDIDHPWKHAHKPLPVMLGGMARSLLTLRFRSFAERWRAIAKGEDPNHTFPELFSLTDPGNTRFFILLDRHHRHDSRFTWKHQDWRYLIEDMAKAGYPLGIHPSYLSYQEEIMIAAEARMLNEIAGITTDSVRMHFLRYALPETRRKLIQARLYHDYTPCRFQAGGFPNGMAVAYPWYDLPAERSTKLVLHPTMIMDRSLISYAKLSPEAAWERYQSLRQATDAVGGAFVACLHNDALSESGEWRGWSDTFRRIIRDLQPVSSEAAEDLSAE